MSEQLKLSHQICFPFYAIARNIIKKYNPYLLELNITYPQYLVLLVLWENDNILIKEICDKLRLETNTVSPLLKTLNSKGLIDRKQLPDNKKQVRILLTQE
jgi:DNA-binding MarR family transcriptional regulator